MRAKKQKRWIPVKQGRESVETLSKINKMMGRLRGSYK